MRALLKCAFKFGIGKSLYPSITSAISRTKTGVEFNVVIGIFSTS